MNANNRGLQNDELIQKLTQIVLENLDNEQFGVTELAEQVGMNRSHLYRKVLVLTKKSLSQFIREIRLSEARKILNEETVTVSEVAYRVGFKDLSYFTSCFHDYYGFPPGKAKHVKLENTLRYTKREKRIDKLRFSFAKKYAFIAIFFFLVIVSMATVLFLKRDKDATEDKSIAVLPFFNDSPDKENEYFINGTMEAILDNLCKIEDLRVIGRTSVEQYRNNPKPLSEIAEEMNVSYILEGSVQKYGNNVRLMLQLLDAINDRHIWSDEYDREIREIEELFVLQSEIAQLVAAEIEAIITPEEKELIEKIPATNLTAYDFYQRGREEHERYWLDNNNREALERAEDLYHKALEYDSTFALAYTGMAEVYRNKHQWKTLLIENFLDSMLILADIALSYDDQLAEAYVIKGNYYRLNNKKEQAIKEYDKAIKFNPNNGRAYRNKGMLYLNDDLVKAISNLQKAASVQRGSFLPEMYRRIGLEYSLAGFPEKTMYYGKEALKLDDDSAQYYHFLAETEGFLGNYEKAIEYGEKSYAIDSTRFWVIFFIGLHHSFLGQFEGYLEYMKKLDNRLKTLDRPDQFFIFHIAHAYSVNGFEKEAEQYFNTGLELNNEMLELDRHYYKDLNTFYESSAIYAFLGDKEKAYEYLRLINQRQRMPLWMVTNIKNDPRFDSIRDEPEFQQIISDYEAKYQAEHERVRQWLEENEML